MTTPKAVAASSNTFLVANFLVVSYSTFFWVQQATIPFLMKKLEASVVTYGYLQSFFAILQLLGGPLYGRFGDLYGSRSALVLAFVSSVLSYLLLSFSYNLPMLFISRLPNILMHAMQGCQMLVTDLSPSEKRTDNLGKLGVSYAVGMVVGNLIGGFFIQYLGEQATAFVATMGSALVIVVIYLFVPDYRKAEKHDSATSSKRVGTLKVFLNMLKKRDTRLLLIVKSVTGLPIGILQSMFPIVLVNLYKVDAKNNGFVMAYIGISSMIVQGVGLAILTKKYSNNTLLKWSTFLLIWGYLGQSMAEKLWIFLITVFPVIIGLTIKNVVIGAALTNTVADEDTGSVLGVNMAINSAIRIIAPTIGGFMLNTFGFPSFGYLGSVNSALVSGYLFKYLPD